MIFQEPMAGFSMVYTIGNQTIETIQLHQGCGPAEARRIAIETLRQVGMPKPEQTIDAYPYALSGGMRQRAMIAMALSCHPSLLIADEPTTAVDVTIQAQVLELLKRLQRDMNMSLMVITHDLAVISELCDRVMIMYLGKDVESAPARSLFSDPKHPYTSGLLKSVPALGRGRGPGGRSHQWVSAGAVRAPTRMRLPPALSGAYPGPCATCRTRPRLRSRATIGCAVTCTPRPRGRWRTAMTDNDLLIEVQDLRNTSRSPGGSCVAPSVM